VERAGEGLDRGSTCCVILSGRLTEGSLLLVSMPKIDFVRSMKTNETLSYIRVLSRRILVQVEGLSIK
jgi:hypothetical protein